MTTIERNRDLGYFIFETMHVSQGCLQRGQYHLARLERSLRVLDWPDSLSGRTLRDWWIEFEKEIKQREPGDYKVKLIITPGQKECEGEIKYGDLPRYPKRITLVRSAFGVHFSGDEFLRLKSGSWGKNQHALRLCPPWADDVLFSNERGDVCETARCNIYVQRGDELWTPPVECGLLPGTYRQYLLDKKTVSIEKKTFRIVENVIPLNSLQNGAKLWVSNALMGFRPAQLVEKAGITT